MKWTTLAFAALWTMTSAGAAVAGPDEDRDLYLAAYNSFTAGDFQDAIDKLNEFAQVCGNYEAKNPGLCAKVGRAIVKAQQELERATRERDYSADAGGESRSVAEASGLPSDLSIACKNC